MGKPLVILLQVVKRTNTPLKPINRRRRQTMFFGVVGSSPTSTIIKFSDFPNVELDKYSPWYTQEMKRLGYIDRSARISGRRAISRRFRGAECYKA